MNILLSSAYLAPIQYYSKFLSADSIVVERHDNYIKQTYRNRCSILSANGVISLSVPVVHSSSDKQPIKDIRIAAHDNWQHTHWNAIVSAYNSTPFFEYYRDDFHPFFSKKHDFLFDFNEELRMLILELLNIDLPRISITDSYREVQNGNEQDMRNRIHPKKDWKSTDPDFIPVPYYQVFEQKFGFTGNLSIIDLLFNMGNESQIILGNSVRR